MRPATVLPGPDQLHLLCLRVERQQIVAVVCASASQAPCPCCGQMSERVHSRYIRRPADLPWQGVAVRLELHVRRFFCGHGDCPQAIFTERLPGVLAPYARRTQRLEDWFTTVGFALGGEAGARLLRELGLLASPDTLLARIRAAHVLAAQTPRVLGVDDWAFRKGRRFGTILVDLERHRPIDLLPDRDATTLATWLTQHPGVEIISRDRAGAYADGARQGAPHAVQVADRWHLLHNLWEVLEGFFVHRKLLLRASHASPHQQFIEATPWLAGRTQRAAAASVQRHQQSIDRYEQIHDLAAKRVDICAIAQRVQISRGTVYRYLRMDQPPVRKQCPTPHALPLDPYKPYLLRRWNEGCRNAQQLWREVRAQGYRQSRATVGRFIGRLRLERGERRKFKTVVVAARADEHGSPGAGEEIARPLTTRRAARLLLTEETQRTAWERATLARLLTTDTEVAATYGLVQGFCQLIRKRRGADFDAWIAQVQARGPAELRAFVQGLLKDEAAVRAGLTLPYSQGQTEGAPFRHT